MILLRHGQSEFNLHFTATRRDPGIADPRLTELGHSQAEQAAEQLADQGIRRIIVSPYTRALQTARPVAARLGVPVSVDPIVRERFAFACDIGSPRAALERDWPGHDFSAVEEVWWPRGGRTRGGDPRPRRALSQRTGGARRLGAYAGDQPLGIHPEPDRAKRRQRPLAALRPVRAGTGTDRLVRIINNTEERW